MTREEALKHFTTAAHRLSNEEIDNLGAEAIQIAVALQGPCTANDMQDLMRQLAQTLALVLKEFRMERIGR